MEPGGVLNVARMPIKGFGDPPKTTTMVCAGCDVTWRGSSHDECWSCGDSSRVTQATPRKVRHTPAVAEADRLVG